MRNVHGGYALVAYDTEFYRGYCCNRELELRKKEHIAAAVSPSATEKENRAIRGSLSEKDKWILAAIEDGEEITIRPIVVKELWEVFDEEEFIQEGKDLGYPITNKAVGGVWQVKIKLEDGTIIDAATRSETDSVSLRADIQEWKRNGGTKPKKVRKSPSFKVPDPKPMTREEFLSARDTAWSLSAIQNKWKGNFKAFCEKYEEGWEKNLKLLATQE